MCLLKVTPPKKGKPQLPCRIKKYYKIIKLYDTNMLNPTKL